MNTTKVCPSLQELSFYACHVEMLHAIEINFLAFLKELGVYDETTNLDVGAFGKFASVIHDESFIPNTGFIMGTSGWVPQDG